MNNYEDDFPARIDLVIEKLNGPSEFARKTGVTLSTIARWRKGEADPSRLNLIKIAEAGNVELQWLVTGQSARQIEIAKKPDINFIPEKEDNFIWIDDYREVKVSAGFGVFNDEQASERTKVEASWLAARRLKADDCAMFLVSGESMYPTLKDGEEIIVDRSKKELREGRIYVINHQGSMWVKKVQIDFNGIKLLSDNKFYSPIILTAEEANELIVIGQVVRGYRDF
ncbi:XRE family transcriptional regulator [Pasteurellaceae bacterium 22721_9_1]